MTFPSAGDIVYYNDAGEPVGWDKPADSRDYYYCDCPMYDEDEEDED